MLCVTCTERGLKHVHKRNKAFILWQVNHMGRVLETEQMLESRCYGSVFIIEYGK